MAGLSNLLAEARLGVPQLVTLGVPPEHARKVRALDRWQQLQAFALPPGIEGELKLALVSALGVDRCRAALGSAFADDSELATGSTPWSTRAQTTTQKLLRLDPVQTQLVAKAFKGPTLVQGVAGSGKTTIAVHRLKRGYDASPGSHHGLFCYNRTLKRACTELFAQLCGSSDLHLPPGVSVETVHSWCLGYLRGVGQRIEVAWDTTRRAYLEDAVQELRGSGAKSAILDRPYAFWKEEIEKVLVGQCAAEQEAYRTVERVGRSTALPPAARRIVWDVYQAYKRRLFEKNLCDLDDALLLARAAIRRGENLPAYRQVIVDEAQDLSKLALEIVVDLARATGAQLVVFADAAQSVYQHGFTWKGVGLTMSPRNVIKLRRNYRNPRAVFQAARQVLPASARVEDGESNTNSGPPPRVIVCESASAEVTVLAREVKALLTRGVRLGSVAVLTAQASEIKKIAETFEREQIPFRSYKEENLELDDASVKGITILSAKGLEFDHVFVLGVDEKNFPGEKHDEAGIDPESWDEQRRRMLYVAMTRSLETLTLLTSRGTPSRYLRDMATCLEWRRASPRVPLPSWATEGPPVSAAAPPPEDPPPPPPPSRPPTPPPPPPAPTPPPPPSPPDRPPYRAAGPAGPSKPLTIRATPRTPTSGSPRKPPSAPPPSPPPRATPAPMTVPRISTLVVSTTTNGHFEWLWREVTLLLGRGVRPGTICVAAGHSSDLELARRALEETVRLAPGTVVYHDLSSAELRGRFAHVIVVRCDQDRFPVGRAASRRDPDASRRRLHSACSAGQACTVVTTRRFESLLVAPLIDARTTRIHA